MCGAITVDYLKTWRRGSGPSRGGTCANPCPPLPQRVQLMHDIRRTRTPLASRAAMEVYALFVGRRSGGGDRRTNGKKGRTSFFASSLLDYVPAHQANHELLPQLFVLGSHLQHDRFERLKSLTVQRQELAPPLLLRGPPLDSSPHLSSNVRQVRSMASLHHSHFVPSRTKRRTRRARAPSALPPSPPPKKKLPGYFDRKWKTEKSEFETRARNKTGPSTLTGEKKKRRARFVFDPDLTCVFHTRHRRPNPSSGGPFCNLK